MSDTKEIQKSVVTPIDTLPIDARSSALTGYLPMVTILDTICGERLAAANLDSRHVLDFTTTQWTTVVKRLADIAGVEVCMQTPRESSDNLYKVSFVVAVYPHISDHIASTVRRLRSRITAEPKYWSSDDLRNILKNSGIQ